MSSFLWILSPPLQKNEVWSSNHMHLFTSKTLSNYKKPQIRGIQVREGGSGKWGAWTRISCKAKLIIGCPLRRFEDKCPRFLFENVHYCKCSWLKEYWTYCNNKSILLVFFSPPSKQTCPNVTEGVRNASPQRLRSLLQPKHFPANRLEANSGVCLVFFL